MDPRVSISLIYIITFTLFIKHMQYMYIKKVLLYTMYFTGFLKKEQLALLKLKFLFVLITYFFPFQMKNIRFKENIFQRINLKVQDL